MHRCDRNPKISIQPEPSRHQSPTRSQTVRRNGLGPITVSRRSKIGPNHLPAPTCVQASVRPDTQGKHAACLVAPSLFDTLADCAPPRAQSHHRFSTVENRSRRPTTPSCVQVSFDRIPEVSIQPAPSRRRAIAPRHARRLCAETGTVTSPFLDGRKSVPSPSRTNMRASLVMTGYPRR